MRALRALEQHVRVRCRAARAARGVTSATSGASCSRQRQLLLQRLLEIDRRLRGNSAAGRSCGNRAPRRAWRRSARAGTGPPRAPRGARPCPRRPGRCRGRWCRWRWRRLALLAGLVERHVRGQDQRAVRRDPQALEHRHALLDQHAALGQQRLERQHHAVADEAAHVLAQDAGGNQRQDGLLAADHQGVAGVVAALEARHRGDALGEQVDDLALALVAPLGADDDDELAHARASAPGKV